ncbi:MAG: hypothetical protein EAZ55_09735 [Cytophagales bacterium]|nr:MAG: hypothetical protein EAZ55_09735 [Cytophagales bacterium]
MQICIRTRVSQEAKAVFHQFDAQLFMRLAPPLPRVKLLRFDGCKKEDWVEIELNFIFFKQRWRSLITSQAEDDAMIFFVDEGVQLPFFLRYWHHEHQIVKQSPTESIIVDKINFRTPFLLFDYLLYPSLYLQFLYRIPIYKRTFSSKAKA